MTDQRNLLVIGIDPTFIDFTHPDYAVFPGLNAEKVLLGLQSEKDKLTNVGYHVELCLTDLGPTAETVVTEILTQKHFDCIVIGAGVRVIPSNFILFEKLINVVHRHAPRSTICFNTKPTDTVEAVQRWLTIES